MNRHLHPLRAAALLLTLALAAPLAQAHDAPSLAGGFASGFAHPLLGWDHAIAMLAVGLWSVLLGAPALWLLPLAFPLVMAAGAALGMLGVPLPAVEIGIAASAVALGAMVASGRRAPLALAAVLVAVFAVFHGHAHGSELPLAANPLAYGLGFLLATALLHLAGIALGLLARRPAGRIAVRGMGAGIALLGVMALARAAG
ncbi:HupE/UreJ family protein [Piscinibacter sp.]|uniref:HupE/UreJ family protein n=1 Tax=Piscinibacter sp. TaxID=1903157 RepID=UPI0039E625C0